MEGDDFSNESGKRHPTSYFSFPPIASLLEATFEQLSLQSFVKLYLLFKNDPSPFVDERFKNYERAKEYAAYLDYYGAYSPKHGC